jgi:tetratricopeptide (TPR) repeat protein
MILKMLRKYLLMMTMSVVAALLLGAGAASAQVGELRGHVVMTQADGTKAPLAGATVDVFRTDIPGKWETKTDKHGDFVYAGLPYVGTYIVSVSAPNAQPEAQGNVKVGRTDLPTITMIPGDGHRYSAEEAKAGATGAARSGGSESAADKAKREEIIRKNKEIEEKNARNTDINATITRTFKAGNDALIAKNYDEAIKQFDEGLAADPDQVVLYSRKAIALRLRGVDHYNLFVKSSDQSVKTAEMDSAKKDFQASAEAATKGVEAAKREEVATDPQAQSSQNLRKIEALSTRAESIRLLTKVDPLQADTGVTAYQEYIAAETDPARKAKGQMELAQMLLDAGAADKAIVEFKKILDAEPDNVDALYGMGIAGINIGYAANDKVKLQEAVNYLQRFVDKAPDTNRYKAEAKATIEELKKQENVTPEKTTAPPRRKRP